MYVEEEEYIFPWDASVFAYSWWGEGHGPPPPRPLHNSPPSSVHHDPPLPEESGPGPVYSVEGGGGDVLLGFYLLTFMFIKSI